MKKFLVLVLALVAFATVSAKGVASPEAKPSIIYEAVATSGISGVIIDKATNESIAGAVITVNDQKIYSDLDGKFSIKNSTGSKLKLKISMISYEDKTIEIDPSALNTIDIVLNQR